MNNFRRLMTLFKPYRGWLMLGILLSYITMLANVGLLAISGWFIATMGLAGVAGVSTNYFTPSALIRAMAIIRTAGRYGERLVTHEATLRVLAGVRVWFYKQIEPLAPAGLAQYRSGDLLSRIRADIDKLDQVYLRLILPVSVAVLAVVVFAVVLAFYHPLLALVEVVMLLVAGALVPWWVHHFGFGVSRKVIKTSSQMRSAVVSDMQGMGELLVYGAAEKHEQQLQVLSDDLASQQQQMNRLTSTAQSAVGLCANLGLWLVLLIAIPLVHQGTIMPADLAMLALFALACFEAVAPMPLAFQALGETAEAMARIFALVDQQPVLCEPEQPEVMPEALNFRFDQVSFSYPEGELEIPSVSPSRFTKRENSKGSAFQQNQVLIEGFPPLQKGEQGGFGSYSREGDPESSVIHQFSVDFPAGKKLAIVGPTGSGKSTLTHLLLKFYEPDSGEVLLNDRSLACFKGDDLRERIAVVPQQTHLFNQSVRNNLLLAKPDATQDELEQVCRLAMVHDTVMEFPEGYDTLTGETGVRVSGGQAKRLVIARALLKPADVLILDEPTEGLDPENAQQLIENIVLECERRGQSLLLITHRLQQLERFDEVLLRLR
uniref:Transport ATP-binding protein CydC n=1 Tax=uncultured Thiotrichaceae bacterium TaxID=298394 RepID=A0A6S6SIY7_9GAMM|nr:MAG: Transport ATP-binding protein CydC [uncultured Thiotrichaceae bacterium]